MEEGPGTFCLDRQFRLKSHYVAKDILETFSFSTIRECGIIFCGILNLGVLVFPQFQNVEFAEAWNQSSQKK